MKIKEEARNLRSKGKSIPYIEKKLNVPRGTVHYWCSDIELTEKQQKQLKENSRTNERKKSQLEKSIERRKEEQKFVLSNISKGHHTKVKGDFAVLRVGLELIDKVDAIISIPFSEHTPYDLIADIDGILYKVQIKARSKRRGVVEVVLGTTFVHKNYNSYHSYKKGDFNFLVVYCPNNDQTYWIGPSDLEKLFERDAQVPTMYLRIDKALNNNKANVNIASKYTLGRMLGQFKPA